MLRILFLGENWYGSSAFACCQALRALGNDVADINGQAFFPPLREKSSRVILKILRPRLVKEYNDEILRLADLFRPNILLSFKGAYVKPDTLDILRSKDIRLYNYYPDTSIYTHGKLLPLTIPKYDCLFHTKHFFINDVKEKIKIKETQFLPHGYDSRLHYPIDLSPDDRAQYECDVGVIATHTHHKEKLLDNLILAFPNIDLKIWGGLWHENNQSPNLKKYIQGRALIGLSYVKAIRAAKINLAILSGRVSGASQGDETTTRTYEIPACKGFMLHERTSELLTLFEEGEEVACFGSTDELVAKIKYYLSRPDERERLIANAYNRCVPAYSYDSRMERLIFWHQQNGDHIK